MRVLVPSHLGLAGKRHQRRSHVFIVAAARSPVCIHGFHSHHGEVLFHGARRMSSTLETTDRQQERVTTLQSYSVLHLRLFPKVMTSLTVVPVLRFILLRLVRVLLVYPELHFQSSE